MTIIKWYSIIYLFISLVTCIYQNGKRQQDGVKTTIVELILIIPIVIYLFLS